MKDYFKVVRRRWWLIAAIVAFACGATATYDYYFPNAIYEANSKLIVTNSGQNSMTARPDMNEINSNIMLIETYKEIIATPAIMEKVVQQYPDIRMDVAKLIESVRVEASKGSQVMSISIQDPSLDQAVMIVNAVAEVFKQEVPQIMSVNNITILSEAKKSDHSHPVSYGMLMKSLIAFGLSLFLALGLVFLLEFLDDSIKTEEDVELYLGLPMLASVTRIRKARVQKNTEGSKKKRVGESIHVGIHR
jgi:capsular polysaccharide biosynthesis protein